MLLMAIGSPLSRKYDTRLSSPMTSSKEPYDAGPAYPSRRSTRVAAHASGIVGRIICSRKALAGDMRRRRCIRALDHRHGQMEKANAKVEGYSWMDRQARLPHLRSR